MVHLKNAGKKSSSDIGKLSCAHKANKYTSSFKYYSILSTAEIPRLTFSLVMLVFIVLSKHIIVGIFINGYGKILRMALWSQ